MGRAARPLKSMPRVFITGLGFVTSIGNDAAAVAASLREMRHGFEVYPPFDKPEITCKVIGTIKGFRTDSTDPEDWTWPAGYEIKRETIRSMAPHGLFAHCAFLQAIADARLGEADISNRDTGLFAASGGSPMLTHFHHERMLRLGPLRCSPLGIVASIVGTLNFNLVAAFKIQGASCGYSSACASSAHAMAYAFEEISLGRQKRMFVVGAEDGNRDAILPFAGMRTLSVQTDPALASRPFDPGRDGFVGTGGGVVIVLESEDEVSRRSVTPYCEVAGWGQASDGYNVAISHPDGTGSRIAMENAFGASGISPAEVDYVNAHATSTLIGDVSEARALRAVFGETRRPPRHQQHEGADGPRAVPGRGHGDGVLRPFDARGVHPGLGAHHPPRPRVRGAEHPAHHVRQSPRVVLKNSSGFGGANVALLMSAPDGPPEPSFMAPRSCPVQAPVSAARSPRCSSARAFAYGEARGRRRASRTSPRATPGRSCRSPSTWPTPRARCGAFGAASQAAGGAFDLVVNNAGYGVFGEFAAVDAGVWRSQIGAMLGTVLSISHAAFGAMRARGRGCLVHVSSLAAEFPLPYMSGYNVAKAGLSALSESLMFESRGTGVTVIDFRPGDYRTDFNRSMHKGSLSTTTQGAWSALEAAPCRGAAAREGGGDLRRALLSGRGGVVRSGSFFQARLAPALARLAAGLLGARCHGSLLRRADLPQFAHVQDPHPCPDLEHRRRPRRPGRGLRGLVLPALPPRRRRADRADAREVLGHQPGRGQFLQQDPGERPVGAQGVLRVGGAPEHPEQGHRVPGQALLRQRAQGVPAAPGPQRPRLPQPGYFQLAREILGARQRDAARPTAASSPGAGLLPKLDRADASTCTSRGPPTAQDFAIKKGIAPEKARVRATSCTRTPTSRSSRPQERGVFREERLGLRPDLFTVFLATGGNGANNHFDLLPALVKRADRCQAIVICGRNKEAYNELVHWRANHPEFNCYVEGYSEIVHLLMQVSDVIVTRGGTTTCAKALHFKCPIIFNASAGIMPQEELTWKYLRNGAASDKIENGEDFDRHHRRVAARTPKPTCACATTSCGCATRRTRRS